MAKFAKLNGSVVGAALLAVVASASAQAADDKISKIKDAGVLRVCQIDYPPMNVKDPTTGDWTGLLVEMSEAFGAALEVEVEHVDATWGTAVQNVKTDKCDMSAGATYVTAKRAVEILYTATVTSDTQAAFVAADSDLNSYEDLDKAGNIIVVNSGSSNEANARATFQNAEVKPIVTERQHTTLLEVASNRADAAFLGVVGSLNFLTSNENLKVRQIDDTELFPAPIAWMVPKGEYHMREVVNAWLASAQADGTIDELETKWMSADN